MFQTPITTRRAKRLRADMTGSEAQLCAMVRNRQVEGLKFRRQSAVAGAIVDFLCRELKLIVELDGGVHTLKAANDAIRDARLREAGFRVLRFSNEAFLTNAAIVLNAIRTHASETRTQPPHPSSSASHLLPRGEKDA